MGGTGKRKNRGNSSKEVTFDLWTESSSERLLDGMSKEQRGEEHEAKGNKLQGLGWEVGSMFIHLFSYLFHKYWSCTRRSSRHWGDTGRMVTSLTFMEFIL